MNIANKNTEITVDDFIRLLTSLGFKLCGSYYLGLNDKDSDIDFVITDSKIYKRTIELLKEMEKQKLLTFRKVKKEKKIEKRQGSLIWYEKAGYEEVSSYSNPIVENTVFDLHLVDKILPKNRQLIEHLLKHSENIGNKLKKFSMVHGEPCS